MSNTQRTAPELSRQSLEMAYRQLREPNRWPATLDAALAHPTYGVCLRAMARNLGRPVWQPRVVAAGLPQGLPVPPTPTQPPVRPPAPRLAPQVAEWRSRGIDLKRAAANDHDD